MTKEGYVVIAILIVAALLAIFIVTFVIYMRTPAPKGCEKLEPDERKCEGCKVKGCEIYYWKKKETDKEKDV